MHTSRLASFFIVVLMIFMMITVTTCDGDNDDVSDKQVFDPVSDQYLEGAYNIGEIGKRPDRVNAAKLAESYINLQGGVLGKKINVVANYAPDTATVVSIGQEYVDRNIPLIVSSSTGRTIALSELTIPKNIVVISESGTSPVLTDLDDNDLVFRVPVIDTVDGNATAEFAIRQNKMDAVIIRTENDIFGETLAGIFQARYEALGGVVLDEVQVPEDQLQGFSNFLPQVYDPDPGVIFNIIFEPPAAASFVNESASYNYQGLTIMSNAVGGNQDFLNNIGNINLLDNFVGLTSGLGSDDRPDHLLFSTLYLQQFNMDPSTYNVHIWDSIIVSALAIERAGFINSTDNPTGLMIQQSLRAVMNAPGEIVSPSNLREGLAMIKAGIDIDYSGSYASVDWDENGDIVGCATFHTLDVDTVNAKWLLTEQFAVGVGGIDSSECTDAE